ncbi:caspase domain-containing protein [Syntrophus buswellii]|uniref:caspase family protein n=1 Tax=Syntrophus buswellii TaxID=43774 RepID=UPI0038D4478E
MERAAVLIGVSKTGNLPELQAVTPSVQRMTDWARRQGIDEGHLQVLTDEKNPVTVEQVHSAITALVDRASVEQLIVYFSGHGINIDSEFWLLSGAPKNVNEAVNVEGSVRLARYCGISHVVLISDACRSAAEGLLALQIKGGEVFPNEPVSGTEKPVDILFSCARGKPSLEIVDPAAAAAEAAKRYSALYTEVLLDYLTGRHQETLHPVEEDGRVVAELRLGELADCLKRDVPARLAAMKIDPKLNQLPDDRISRHTEDAWIARMPFKGRLLSRTFSPGIPAREPPPVTPFTVSEGLVSASLEGDQRKWKELLSLESGGRERGLLEAVATQAEPFGPMHFETQCGFKIRGARIVDTVQRDVDVELLGTAGDTVRVGGLTAPGANVLLVLENGCGVAVPALPDFIAALSFEGGQLVDVSYEPSENTWRWGEYAHAVNELRSLRATIAASAALGVFRLNEEGGLALARRMQYAKGVDPSLALYAAYVYDSLQRRDLIDEMRSYMEGDLGLVFFDVALLSRAPIMGRFVPPFPMLSQGWALLSAYRAQLPPSLHGIEQCRVPSLWTMFNGKGVAMLRKAILSGGIER